MINNTKHIQQLYEDYFEENKYVEIIEHFEQIHDDNILSNNIVMPYVVESYFELGKYRIVEPFIEKRLKELKFKIKSGGLSKTEKENFDIFFNAEIEIFILSNSFIRVIIESFKYHKWVIDKNYLMNYIAFSLKRINRRMIIWLVIMLLLFFVLYPLAVFDILFPILKNLYTDIFYSFLIFYFFVILSTRAIGEYFYKVL